LDQRLHDGSHKDIRRARAAALNMVPTTTGAARALSLVIPALKGRLDGFAIRVPTPDVSIVDLTCELDRATSKEEVNAVMKAAANESFGYCEEPLVSSDFVGSTFGGVLDAGLTTVMDGTQVKLIVWYDNEAASPTSWCASSARWPSWARCTATSITRGGFGPLFFCQSCRLCHGKSAFHVLVHIFDDFQNA
jgi:glyceraldehyde-3-phosphate dehydrogenase type I